MRGALAALQGCPAGASPPDFGNVALWFPGSLVPSLPRSVVPLFTYHEPGEGIESRTV